jgi:hypothetical protein
MLPGRAFFQSMSAEQYDHRAIHTVPVAATRIDIFCPHVCKLHADRLYFQPGESFNNKKNAIRHRRLIRAGFVPKESPTR